MENTPRIIEITDLDMPELDVYVRLTGKELRNRRNPERGIFIAESPTVIDVALSAGCEPVSLLTEKRLINSDVRTVIERVGDVPIYIAERDVLRQITGFDLTRGALCAMKRPKNPPLSDLLAEARRVAVLEGVCDSTNIGAVFRSAAAMNIDAVLLTPTCCDPLCRRALRVSMGTVLQVPWGYIGTSMEDWQANGLDTLRAFGFRSVAMALSDDSLRIDDPALAATEKLAIVLGTEGDGLTAPTVRGCDYVARIPMSHGVDSLNVASAGAVAFWELAGRNIK